MDLPIVGSVTREPLIRTTDPYVQAEAWGAPVTTPTHGWWAPSPAEVTPSPGRRAEDVERAVMVPAGFGGGDRDRWTFPDGTFLQVGAHQDNSDGPFGMQTPLVVYLRSVKG